ncbi:MAG: response regulator [Thermodesulfobacteriota bacterium]|nr:response regulator [Thermodesulfobacteriota bacterium]
MSKQPSAHKAMTPYRVLLAEDDGKTRTLLARVLRKSGYEVVECPDGMEMLTHLAAFLLPEGVGREKLDLIISESCLPGVSGMEVLEDTPGQKDFPPVIMLKAGKDKGVQELESRFCNVAAMFDKPFHVGRLLGTVRTLLN